MAETDKHFFKVPMYLGHNEPVIQVDAKQLAHLIDAGHIDIVRNMETTRRLKHNQQRDVIFNALRYFDSPDNSDDSLPDVAIPELPDLPDPVPSRPDPGKSARGLVD